MGDRRTRRKLAKVKRKARDPRIISYTMSRIRSKDTSIELTLRAALWGAGLRYRKH
jgi:DNA mismatch endonuclease, patch repair protein